MSIEKIIRIMDELLSPQGCPWDREQNHKSLIRYLIEESYEVVEAIELNDMGKLKEELGDLLLQVVFHAAIAERAGAFNFNDVVDVVVEKMIRRHPHVFGQMDLKTSDQVLQNWDEIKKQEGRKKILEGIPLSLPALMRADKLQSKAARVGFDWSNAAEAFEKALEEAEELVQAKDEEDINEEMGDLFFALVNVARLKNIDPEQALQRCNDKFTRRFEYIENKLMEKGESLQEVKLEEMDKLWDEAKAKGL